MKPIPTPRLPGCCARCDRQIFEVQGRTIGAARAEAMLATFSLRSGALIEVSLCRECARRLKKTEYPFLWQRLVLSWLAVTKGEVTPWLRAQGDNGLAEFEGARPWDEAVMEEAEYG